MKREEAEVKPQKMEREEEEEKPVVRPIVESGPVQYASHGQQRASRIDLYTYIWTCQSDLLTSSKTCGQWQPPQVSNLRDIIVSALTTK